MRSRVRRLSVLAAGALLLAGLGLFVGLGGLAGSAVASSAPFSDPSAVGFIGLCDRTGHQIESGSIFTTPFAWRAVSSKPAPAPYDNAWRTAILLAFQPRQGLAPGEWSGDELTASSRYSNPLHPMVAATNGDDSLEDFMQEYAPEWNGFFELRIYLGTENAEPYSLHYPVLDVEVVGHSWYAVGGGPVNCRSGRAVSLETVVLPGHTGSHPARSHAAREDAVVHALASAGGPALVSRVPGAVFATTLSLQQADRALTAAFSEER